MRVCGRAFSPFCSAAASCPARRTAWRLKPDNPDYRASAIFGAMGNANGGWFSRRDERVRGELNFYVRRRPSTCRAISRRGPERHGTPPKSRRFGKKAGRIKNRRCGRRERRRPVGSKPSTTTACSRAKSSERIRMPFAHRIRRPPPRRGSLIRHRNPMMRRATLAPHPTVRISHPPTPPNQEDELPQDAEETHTPDSAGSFSAKYDAPPRRSGSGYDPDWYSQAWGGGWNHPWGPQANQRGR